MAARARAGPIVVVGSHVAGLVLEVDAVPREGESVLGTGFSEPVDGGKATNQAVAAAKLGAPVRLVTLLGDDERGDRWRGILAGYGMDTAFVMQTPGATDVGFVLLPPSRIPAIASSIALSVALEAALIERAGNALDDASLVLCQLGRPQAVRSPASGSRAPRVRARCSTRRPPSRWRPSCWP
jgi:ribokinase